MITLPTISKEEAENDSFLLLDDIAYIVWNHDQRKLLYAVDLRNNEHCAAFIFNPTNMNFDLYINTFPDGKRKFEMLYILERNNNEIVKVWQ